MNYIKIFVKYLLSFSKIFGYKININKISSNTSHVLIDKNIWEPFLYSKNNSILNIYNEAIRKSNSRYSDSLLKQLRFYSLFEVVENIISKNEYENFVECGCWKGHSSYGISTILKKNNFKKKFYIIDSFEGGLSKKIKSDINTRRYIQNKNEITNQKNHFYSKFEDVKNLLSDFKFIEIYKGWIPEVFNKIKSEKFSFIHIDLDLYNPTFETINFFYDKLIEGGIIVCDDYNCSDFPGAKLAIDKFIINKKVSLFYEVPLGGCIIIK